MRVCPQEREHSREKLLPHSQALVSAKAELGPYLLSLLSFVLGRSNCAENIRKHILHTGKHEGVKMYNCPKCDYGTNVPVEFRNHLKEQHPDIENPDLAYLHAGKGRLLARAVLRALHLLITTVTMPLSITVARFHVMEPVTVSAPRRTKEDIWSHPTHLENSLSVTVYPEQIE